YPHFSNRKHVERQEARHRFPTRPPYERWVQCERFLANMDSALAVLIDDLPDHSFLSGPWIENPVRECVPIGAFRAQGFQVNTETSINANQRGDHLLGAHHRNDVIKAIWLIESMNEERHSWMDSMETL